MVSNGCVAYTVIVPAIAPVAKVVALFWGRLFLRDVSFSTLYEPMRTAEVADCFMVVDTRPRYRPGSPCAERMDLVASNPPRKRRWLLFASSMRAVLTRSVGVTAATLSTAPASMPARMPLDGDKTPLSSARRLRI